MCVVYGREAGVGKENVPVGNYLLPSVHIDTKKWNRFKEYQISFVVLHSEHSYLFEVDTTLRPSLCRPVSGARENHVNGTGRRITMI